MALQQFRICFVPEREGAWRCTKPAAFLLPNGHKIEIAPGTVLSPGTTFMGIDLAMILDAEHSGAHPIH